MAALPILGDPERSALDWVRSLEGFVDYAREHSQHPQDRARWETAIDELRDLRQALEKLEARSVSDDDLRWILS